MVNFNRRGSLAGAALFACYSLVSAAKAQDLPVSPSEAPPTFPSQTSPPLSPAGEAPPPASPTVSPSPVAWGARLLTSWVSEMNATTVFLTPQVELDYRIAADWHLGGTWALAWLLDNQGLSQSLAKAGNPLIEAAHAYQVPGIRITGRLGVTLPIVTVPLGPDGRLHTFLVNQNLAMTGMWNAWSWLRDYFAIPLQARFEHPLPDGSVLVLEGAVVPILGVRAEGTKTKLMAQTALACRMAMFATVELRPRVQAVLLPSGGLERFQAAAGLRISRRTRPRYYLDILVNLGKPNGIMGGMRRFGFALGKELE